jgi:hypothetical protein
MNNLPANVNYITNDTEQSFVIQNDNGHTDLSILSSAGSDPACICRAQYREGQESPISEEMLHIPPEEKGLLTELLHRSKFI